MAKQKILRAVTIAILILLAVAAAVAIVKYTVIRPIHLRDQATRMVKQSDLPSIARDYYRERTEINVREAVKKTIRNIPDAVILHGWKTKHIEGSTYLVSFTFEQDGCTKGWWFEAVLDADMVRFVNTNRTLCQRHNLNPTNLVCLWTLNDQYGSKAEALLELLRRYEQGQMDERTARDVGFSGLSMKELQNMRDSLEELTQPRPWFLEAEDSGQNNTEEVTEP